LLCEDICCVKISTFYPSEQLSLTLSVRHRARIVCCLKGAPSSGVSSVLSALKQWWTQTCWNWTSWR